MKRPSLNILLVEDNKLVAEVVEKTLSELGCQVTPVETGKEAIAQTLTQAFDIIFLDLGLPDLKGTQIAQTVRNNANINQNSRLIVLTAELNEQIERSCLELGVDLVLQKPLTKEVAKMSISC